MTSDRIKVLVYRAQHKEKDAFVEIYNYYYDKLLAYAFRRTLNIEAARDIVANTFEIVLKKLSSFKWRHDRSFNGWIYRIATHEIYHYYRDTAKYVSSESSDSPEVSDEGSGRTEIENKLLNDDRFVVLNRALQQLKPIYRELIQLRYFEDLSLQEIADATNKREVTVRVYLHRALTDLRDTLKTDSKLLFDSNLDVSQEEL